MTFLLDTNVLSEARKRRSDAGVAKWITEAKPESLYLSTITVGEIERGIIRVRGRGDHQQAEVFETWRDQIIETFGERIVPVSVEIAREWGAQSGRWPTVPVPDALIAATAQVRGWTVVTRNVRDFERRGVRVLNPFTA